uniref:Uncharacterized protein n=1 Tax=Guillardia theta TaxID=55529 RepID=A0A7S4PCA4_GUITH|mmetsp:Transcript_47579/g.149050  ORF Transcript_47579/g.149050 Transcript_47579/m.149050 type:complete len:770 (+) Transcript_47579:176-2485(+)
MMQPTIDGIRSQKNESLERVQESLQQYQELIVTDDRAKVDDLRYRIDSLISRHEESQTAADMQLLQVDSVADRRLRRVEDLSSSDENLNIVQFEQMVMAGAASHVERLRMEMKTFYSKMMESVMKMRAERTDASSVHEAMAESPGVRSVERQRSVGQIERHAEFVTGKEEKLEERIKVMEQENREARRRCLVLEAVRDSAIGQLEEAWQRHIILVKQLLSAQQGGLDPATEKLLDLQHELQKESAAKDALIAQLDADMKQLTLEKEEAEESNAQLKKRVKSLRAASSLTARLAQQLQQRKQESEGQGEGTGLEPSQSWRSFEALERNRNLSQSSTTTRDLNVLSALDMGEDEVHDDKLSSIASFSRSHRPNAPPQTLSGHGSMHSQQPTASQVPQSPPSRSPPSISSIEFWRDQVAEGDQERAQRYLDYITDAIVGNQEEQAADIPKLITKILSPAMAAPDHQHSPEERVEAARDEKVEATLALFQSDRDVHVYGSEYYKSICTKMFEIYRQAIALNSRQGQQQQRRDTIVEIFEKMKFNRQTTLSFLDLLLDAVRRSKEQPAEEEKEEGTGSALSPILGTSSSGTASSEETKGEERKKQISRRTTWGGIRAGRNGKLMTPRTRSHNSLSSQPATPKLSPSRSSQLPVALVPDEGVQRTESGRMEGQQRQEEQEEQKELAARGSSFKRRTISMMPGAARKTNEQDGKMRRSTQSFPASPRFLPSSPSFSPQALKIAGESPRARRIVSSRGQKLSVPDPHPPVIMEEPST